MVLFLKMSCCDSSQLAFFKTFPPLRINLSTRKMKGGKSLEDLEVYSKYKTWGNHLW